MSGVAGTPVIELAGGEELGRSVAEGEAGEGGLEFQRAPTASRTIASTPRPPPPR